VCIVPACATVIAGLVVYFISDDTPKGNYRELKRRGCMPEVSAAASFKSGAININTWLLFVQYACSFGTELTMNNAAALYFIDQFGQTTEQASAIASIFGWMNLFARGMGGFVSDSSNARIGMRGRLMVHATCLACGGAMVLIFANTNSLAGSIVVMVVIAICVQAASGSAFAIVPYVDPPSTGSIAGIVGAGGNIGAVCFGLAFRQLDYKHAFVIMGSIVLFCSTISTVISVKGHRGLLFGKDEVQTDKPKITIAVPEKDLEATEEVNAK
jgi:NNP family nitrate/nitrite transporter-like MFS transporter